MSQSSSSPYEALKAGFRRACIRRLVGDEKAAIAVLRDEIPGLVVAWAKSSDLDAPEKKAKLKELFDDESARADELASAFDLFSSRFEVRVAELVRQEISSITSKLDESIQFFKNSFGHLIDLEKEHRHQIADNLKQSQPLVYNKSLQSNDLLPELMEGVTEDTPAKVEGIETGLTSLKQDMCMVGDGLRFDEIEEMIDEILSASS